MFLNQMDSLRLRVRFPDYIPVIIRTREEKNTLPIILPKSRFLIPMEATISGFQARMRKECGLCPTQAYYLFVNKGDRDILLSGHQIIGQIYRDYADKDGFLYFIINTENTFGK